MKIPQRFKSQSAGNQKVLENVENLFNLDQPLVDSSETKRASSSNEDVDFGDWLAGLIDGDGCFSFNGNVCRCEITLDAKDVQTLHEIKSKLGGSVTKRSKVEAYRWRSAKRSVMIQLIGLINGKLLTPSKHSQLIKLTSRKKLPSSEPS